MDGNLLSTTRKSQLTHRNRKRDFVTLSNSDSHGLLVGRHGFSVKTWVFKGELLVIRHGLLVGRHGFSMKSEVFRHLSRIIAMPSRISAKT